MNSNRRSGLPSQPFGNSGPTPGPAANNRRNRSGVSGSVDNGLGDRISGGGNHEEFNLRLLISCAIGGAIGTVLALMLIGSLYTEIPNILLFAIVMALISLGVLLGAVTSSDMYGESLPKTIAIALVGALIMFAAAALFEFLYELHFTIKLADTSKEQREICLTDYIFCIDDSGSMYDNDPNGIRDSALADLLDNIDSSCQVGLLRYESRVKSKEYVYPALLNDDQKQLLLDVINNHSYGGGTNFENALSAALKEYKQINEKGRMPVVVLLTDGECGLDVQKWVDKYNEEGVTICAIYLGVSEQIPQVLEELCSGTNGIVMNAESANELVETYGNLVDQTASTRLGVAYDPAYYRFLGGPRRGADRAYILAIIERLLFFGLLGVLLGLIIWKMLGDMLSRQPVIGGICGLIGGAIVEFGYLMGLGTISRIGFFMYIIVIANYLIVDDYLSGKWKNGSRIIGGNGGGSISGTGRGNRPPVSSGTMGQRRDKQSGGRIN